MVLVFSHDLGDLPPYSYKAFIFQFFNSQLHMGSNNTTVWEVTIQQFGFEFQVERYITFSHFKNCLYSWQTWSQHFQAVCIKIFHVH